MKKNGVFAILCCFFAFSNAARADDLPLCNDERLEEIVSEAINTHDNKGEILSPLGARSFELIKKYGKELAEVDIHNADFEDTPLIKDKILELKINKDIHPEDMRLCKGTYTKIKNTVYALIYPEAGEINVYVITSMGSDKRDYEIKY